MSVNSKILMQTPSAECLRGWRSFIIYRTTCAASAPSVTMAMLMTATSCSLDAQLQLRLHEF